MTPADVDPSAARKAAATAERMVDRQFQLIQTLSERSDGIMRLGVAELGGITAITGFALATNVLTPSASLLIVLSAFLGIGGVFSAVRGSVGTWKPNILRVGPDIKPLREIVEDDLRSETETDLAIMATLDDVYATNSELTDERFRLLVAASYLLLASAAVFMGAVFFIVGGLMHG